jgi:hypothetical protein
LKISYKQFLKDSDPWVFYRYSLYLASSDRMVSETLFVFIRKLQQTKQTNKLRGL